MKRSVLICLFFAAAVGFAAHRNEDSPYGDRQIATANRLSVPEEDVRLTGALTAELTGYKKNFRLPEWAKQGRARQIRFDGGPMFAACQLESGWEYLTDPKTPGYVGIIRSVWTLPNLYTDQIERRLDDIRAAGYNWVWVSYQLGYAFEDEARQRAQVRRLIRLAHARGIHVTAYFSLTSIFTNSAFPRDPESRNWVQENSDGKPNAYAGIPTRLMACVNKPGRLEYLKRIVRLAVQDGADDIFYDSISNRCHCSYCARGFREYCKRVLGKEYDIPRHAPRKEKQFDITENFDFTTAKDGALDALFAEYGQYAVAKAISELDRYAKSINPHVLVSANTHRFRYVNDVTDVTWNEDANRAGGRIDEKGKLVTPVGVYQWAQAVANGRKPIELTVAPHDYWEIQPPEYYEQTVADAAAFQANFVMLGGYAFAVRWDDGDPVARRAWEGISTGLRFVAQNPADFEGARPVADVGIYYSYPSHLRPQLARDGSAAWTEVAQNLALGGVPARVVTDQSAVRRGARQLLAENRAIVLAGTPCLSNNEVAVLQDYAALGGRLLVTRSTGLYTGFWTRRPTTPWAAGAPGVYMLQAGDLSTPSKAAATVNSALNRPGLIALTGGTGYQMAVPNMVNGRLVIHLINYDRTHNLSNLKITLNASGYSGRLAPTLNSTRVAQWLTPRHSSGVRLPVVRKGPQAEIVIPELKVSGILVLEPGAEKR